MGKLADDSVLWVPGSLFLVELRAFALANQELRTRTKNAVKLLELRFYV
jgi:hypothetical protein